MSYYNTNGLSGIELKQAVLKAKKQMDAIFLIYLNTRKAISPYEMYQGLKQYGINWPITSIRARITTLQKDGHLIKTDEMVPGMYKDPEHKWKINAVKHPTITANQQSLYL